MTFNLNKIYQLDANYGIKKSDMEELMGLDKTMLDNLKADLIQSIKTDKEFSKALRQPVETDADKVVRILKHDFEKKHGMTFDKFIEVYNDLLKNNPERLI